MASTAVTELHGAMKEVERRRDVERDRRERRGESQLVAVKLTRAMPPAPLWWRSTRARALLHCLRALPARARAARTCSACSRIGSAPPK